MPNPGTTGLLIRLNQGRFQELKLEAAIRTETLKDGLWGSNRLTFWIARAAIESLHVKYPFQKFQISKINADKTDNVRIALSKL